MNNKIISAIITASIMLLLLLVCLIIGYYPPNPPIPEEGVEVAMGYDEAGFGNMLPNTASPQQQITAAANDYSTQSTENTTSIPNNSKGRITNPHATNNSKAEQKEAINNKALYSGRKNNTSEGHGQGDSQGHGQQGNPNGIAGSTNYQGQGGNGMYDLAGRKSVSLPLPSKDFTREGKIRVTIWVDQQGLVTKAEYSPGGSNISDEIMVNQAIQAAKRARFSPDPSATILQKGSITYVYRKQ